MNTVSRDCPDLAAKRLQGAAAEAVSRDPIESRFSALGKRQIADSLQLQPIPGTRERRRRRAPIADFG